MTSDRSAPDVVGTVLAEQASEPRDGPTRRCWRCLQNFACAADDVAAGPAQWWLCDPCQLTLIGPRSNRAHG
jgi:hypothetical protein